MAYGLVLTTVASAYNTIKGKPFVGGLFLGV